MEKKRQTTNILTFFKKTKLDDNKIVNKKSENEIMPQNKDNQFNLNHLPAAKIENTRDIGIYVGFT